MTRRTKLLAIAIAATLILALAAGAASARNLSFSEQGFRLVWSELSLEAGGRHLSCPVTLEGSFERASIVKRANATVGRISRAALGTCNPEGRLTILTETLPWNVNYASFIGTLPNITGVTLNLISAALQVELEGITCLFRSEANQPFRWIARVEAGGRITELRIDESATITTSGGFFCSLSGGAHFAGTANATGLGNTTHPTLTLI